MCLTVSSQNKKRSPTITPVYVEICFPVDMCLFKTDILSSRWVRSKICPLINSTQFLFCLIRPEFQGPAQIHPLVFAFNRNQGANSSHGAPPIIKLEDTSEMTELCISVYQPTETSHCFILFCKLTSLSPFLRLVLSSGAGPNLNTLRVVAGLH